MVQSVELVLDPALEERVRAQWRALVEADLPSLGRHTGPTNRPHVTLGVAQGVAPEHEERLVAAVDAARALPLPVRLGGLVLLGGHKHVLARLVVPSVALLQLHGAVHQAWRDTLDRPDHMAPGVWTPHVTLALHLNDSQVGQALTALRRMPDAGRDADGEAVALRRWDSTARVVWEVGRPPPAG
ncbi:2'-5' RNA ligase family protein [Aquipuribacter sp. MA13-6]|uniref:2'-5' RNA ligase family protein n=1 Tax=unclassified Aquipuribacter TaxID=2635084 RepID=UPI003EF0720A